MSRRLEGRLVVATHNAGKLREMRELLAPHGIDCVSAGELNLPEPEETGTTFEENALIKARAAAEATKLPSFADDSGLCVEALGGDPGIYSARWAGESKDFAAAMAEVERKLVAAGGTSDAKRRGYFVSVLALVWPDGHEEIFRGEVHGQIVLPRGTAGFGYDPLFLPDGHTRTFGEMTSEEKHGIPPDGSTALSHRARAFQLLAKACLA